MEIGTFHLPNKKALQTSSIEFEIVLVDATVQPVERPQKNSGSKHDFQVFKESGFGLSSHVLLFADAGYQGVAQILQHPNSQTSTKKTN
ncbi:MAG: hypothetical protein CDV28_1021 [Candidatus Electronema aureum]|uniref:DDE superfamily endonuclease n=1 Tax=Candidatus Electronema aureum TaxID=2005002 RepID=A0A521G4C2_9BACT|nr:MAG: hypothetical protein CDV28_1021 [Candidatus Electronema aureum]